jgi:peptidoglycan/xylan/chitin deacetylase (PgdA/CDA1 family)
MLDVSAPRRARIPLVPTAAGAGLVACCFPAASWGTQNTAAALITALVAISIAGTLSLWVAARVPRRRLTAAGMVLVPLSALLVAVTPRGPITAVIAVPLGVGVGLLLPSPRPLRDRESVAALAVSAGIGAILLVAAGATIALWFGSVLAVGAGVVTLLRCPAPPRGAGRRGTLLAAVSLAWVLLLAGWVAANEPTVNWFGGTISHGPRSGNEVAITFDDGPDVTYTLDVRDILDRYGVKATFFTVGKALDAHPEISQALLADGQLLGDHSYHHDQWRWLDPRYPELARTQEAFQRQLGVCPAFYRPPHGQRTPFISWLVHDRGMAMVTWDVSAADWTRHDGAGVADDILQRVRPGSIILLHDGLDGSGHADRSVLLTALPRLLDGLRDKGLQPVRLDQLLDKPAYVPC